MAMVFEQKKVDSGMPRGSEIPSAIIDNKLMSDTSLAEDCFIKQRFSNKLQAYMIGYVNTIYSNYSVYK
jgi:hypothetical protein